MADGSKSILVVGGTGFIGPWIVRSCLAAGMAVTVFNRGKSNPALFPGIETVVGDRDPQKGLGLELLKGRRWDAVVDTCGYVPRVVGASAGVLAGSVGQYVFVSSISVYSDLSGDRTDESSAVGGELSDPSVETVTGETYGPLKVLCERAIEAAMPGRVCFVRPGLIVGPGDSTDRFMYWPVRMGLGGRVVAPGDAKSPVQFIDVRDLAEFVVGIIQREVVGVVNAVGPKEFLGMGELLEACNRETGSKAELVWMDSEFLIGQGLRPWVDLPLWVPDAAKMRGFAHVNRSKAIAVGMRCRPAEVTIRDTFAWHNQRGSPALKTGISADREQEVLREWDGRK